VLCAKGFSATETCTKWVWAVRVITPTAFLLSEMILNIMCGCQLLFWSWRLDSGKQTSSRSMPLNL